MNTASGFFHEQKGLTQEEINEVDKDRTGYDAKCGAMELMLTNKTIEEYDFCVKVNQYITEKCKEIGNVPEYCTSNRDEMLEAFKHLD